MNITLVKRVVFKKTRMSCNCPCCKAKIVLDADVFADDPKTISCYKCNNTFDVTQVSRDKSMKMELQINKVKK